MLHPQTTMDMDPELSAVLDKLGVSQSAFPVDSIAEARAACEASFTEPHKAFMESSLPPGQRSHYLQLAVLCADFVCHSGRVYTN